MIFFIGFKDLADVRHGVNCDSKIWMQVQTHCSIDGRSQAGGLVNMGFCRGQTEYIGG